MSRKVATVPHRGLFIQRIGSRNHPQVTLIKFRLDFDDLHRHWFALRREGFTITKKQRHIAAPLTQCRQRVTVHGRV